MPNLRPNELLIILVIILVLFGGAKLPQLAKNLGRAQREFRDGIEDGQSADGDKSSGSDQADESKT